MEHITFRLRQGQYLKEEIEKTVREKNIKAGVLLSVVGGLLNATLRMSGSTPGNQNIKEWEGPFEIVSGTGTLSEDGCHIHISLARNDGMVIGGHLKDGCAVYSTAEIVLGVFEDTAYKRTLDAETGFKELEIG
jgi:predicted DNA-binding protein with PD1-like motif